MFEDIVLLDKKAVGLVCEAADELDLAMSIKGVEKPVREHIFTSATPALFERLKNTIEDMGPVRLSEVERAQQRIVKRIRSMEERGEIQVINPRESVV